MLKVKFEKSRIRSHGMKPASYAHIVNPKGWTYAEANAYAQSVSDHLAKKGKGRVWISLKYNTNWMDQRGGATLFGAPVRLWTYDDYDDQGAVEFVQDKFHELTFWYQSEPKKKGGEDQNNDCLFNVISWLLNRVLPEKFNTAEKLKAALKVKRNAPISINLMPTVEKLYKVNIKVTGDHTYQGSTKYNKTIEFQLNGGHYWAPNDPEKKKMLHVQYDYGKKGCKKGVNKDLNVYRIEEGTTKVYTGKETLTMTYTEFIDFKVKYRDERIFYKADKDDLIKEFNQYKADAKAIYEASNGDINLYNSPAIHCHAKDMFWRLSNSTTTPEPIGQIEASFLKGRAALIKAVNGTYKNVWDYDVNTMYGYLMTINMYPMKEGEFVTLTELPEKLEYGIYMCNITPHKKEKLNMLFRFSDENRYTHYDIMSARHIGLKVKLLQQENNALIYTKEKLEYGSRLFKPTIDYLYDLKVKEVPRMKHMISSLWGSLCEVAEKKVTIGWDEDFESPKNTYIKHIYRIGNKIRVTYAYNDERQFQTNYARMGVFLTSQSRLFMARTLFDHIDDIVKVHTDGFLSLKEIPRDERAKLIDRSILPKLKIGTKLGQWKVKQYNQAIIENSNKRPIFT